MRGILIFLSVSFCSVAFASAEKSLTLGLGYEARVVRDVNPDFPEGQNVGQLYLSYAVHPWSALWEFDRLANESKMGNYSIATSSYRTMLWGRYEPWALKWSPYVGGGLGYAFHNVTTTFGTARNERWTDGGGVAGLSGGVMTTLFNHWNLEGEFRVCKLELSPDAVYGFTVRSGYSF